MFVSTEPTSEGTPRRDAVMTSSLPETKLAATTGSGCWSGGPTGVPSAEFQIRAVPSRDVVTRRSPLALKRLVRITSSWLSSLPINWQVVASTRSAKRPCEKDDAVRCGRIVEPEGGHAAFHGLPLPSSLHCEIFRPVVVSSIVTESRLTKRPESLEPRTARRLPSALIAP
jgi:hypothetical protein